MPRPLQPREDVLHCLEGALKEGKERKGKMQRESTMVFLAYWQGQTCGDLLST